jgi:uncharacterized phage protein gp47/JayE
MTTYPLPTIACTIDENGISSPSYADIYASLQATFQSIYGSDGYIDPDSEDGQMLAVFARGQYDSNQATIAAYNNFSPATSQGTGLSTMVKVNGIARGVPTFSVCALDVSGIAGTPIAGGVVEDNQNLKTQWALPVNVVIPPSGVITVTAICTQPGSITAQPGTLQKIVNPTAGWQSVNNSSSASPGIAVESDAQLRIRQTYSTAMPATTPNESVVSAVANILGVTRVKVYENDQGSTDSNGLPSHSLCVVVEGGDVGAIAQAIQLKKTIGAQTFGTTTQIARDSSNNLNTINFSILSYDNISVSIKLTALAGYTSLIGSLISAAVVEYINDLDIGQNVYRSRLWTPANLNGTAAIKAVSAQLGAQQTQADLDKMSATFEITELTVGAPPFAALDITDIASAGNGYVVGDTIIIAGGTTTDPTVLTVDSLGAAGSVASAHISHPGVYSVYPTNPVAQASSNGAGVQAFFDIDYLSTDDVSIAFDAVPQTSSALVAVEVA